jgi:hypothetical protein
MPTLQAWITARVIVAAALAFSHYLVDNIGAVRGITSASVRSGLLAWDGAWYSDIASRGYAALPREALRFFPAFPVTARVLGALGLGERLSLVLISNVSAFVAGLLLYRLVRKEGGDRGLATRAVWLLALAPPAFVFVMGYTDATAVALAIATMYLLREKRWWWAALCAVTAGLWRPTAFLLAVPALVEAVRGFGDVGWRERLARLGVICAAPFGTLIYLVWVGSLFGNFLLPFKVQTSAHLRGRLTDPISAVVHGVRGAFDGHIGTALHVPWFILIVVLTIAVCRKWPLSYSAFTVAVVLSAVTSNNLDSMERYSLLAFPILIAAAQFMRSRNVERIVFVLAPVAMFGYATLAFLGLIGP